jgi:hypothetical protein
VKVYLLYDVGGDEEFLVDIFASHESAQRRADEADARDLAEYVRYSASYKKGFPFIKTEWRIKEHEVKQ